MTAQDRLRAWLLLARVPGLGPRTIAQLLEHFSDPERVLAAGPGALADAGLRRGLAEQLAAPDEAGADADLRWAEEPDAHILTLEDPRYPWRLREIPDAPPVLYVRGDTDVLSDPQVAIVGSRNPSTGGREVTVRIAQELAACGVTITSGLALGIDRAAHEGALRRGTTLAVLGTGPDRVYPAVHRDLARRVAAQGALVTEFPPGTPARAGHFPRRNRLISGLSVGTLVTEAAQGSGSLITARCAMEQGREVFAVPGSIRNPMARGCHALIRDGAKLVETARDVLEELAPLLRASVIDDPDAAAGRSAASAAPKLEAEYENLLAAMGHDPVSADELIRRVGMPAESVASMLLLLELEGYVSSEPGGHYCRTRGPTDPS